MDFGQNIDFDSEVARIARALKDADEQKNTSVDHTAGTSGFIGQQLSRLAGTLGERDALERQRELSAAEGQQANALTQQLFTPGTKRGSVLAKTLAPDQAGPEQTVEGDVPLDPVEENQRQMALAAQMSRLPKTRQMGNLIMSQGASFPARWAESRERAEERLLEKTLAGQQKQEAAAQRVQDQAVLLRLAAGLKPAPQAVYHEADIKGPDGVVQRYSINRSNPRDRVLLGEAPPKGAAGEAAAGKAEKAEEARMSASNILDKMDAVLVNLEKGGGLVDKTKPWYKNLPAYAAATDRGQEVSRSVGTVNQAERDRMESLRVQLLTELKQAKGMSAQEMNSNVELRLRLEALGGNKMEAGALRDIVNDSRELFRLPRKERGISAEVTAPAQAAQPDGPATGRKKFNPATGRLE